MNNTGTNQLPCRLISAFVIHFLESVISKLATGEISIFYLVPVAEETSLSLALSETPMTGLGQLHFTRFCLKLLPTIYIKWGLLLPHTPAAL